MIGAVSVESGHEGMSARRVGVVAGVVVVDGGAAGEQADISVIPSAARELIRANPGSGSCIGLFMRYDGGRV